MPDKNPQAVDEIVTEWMRLARSNLVIANMLDNEAISAGILAFHAQQAAEKALKAFLVKQQKEFPKTHIIGVLLNLVKEAGSTVDDENLERAALLSRYAVSARYPGEMQPVSRQEASQACELANQVVGWVESQLKNPD